MYGNLVRQRIEDQARDIPWSWRLVLMVLLITMLVLLTGCATPVKVEEVKRHPPTAAMVPCLPLPIEMDPSLGGIYKGYANAAREYRNCAGRLKELQDYENGAQ